MTKHEKLILLLIVLVLVGRGCGLARDIYIVQTYGAIIPSDVEYYWEQISLIFSGLVNIGAAVWLFIEAKSISLKAWVWSLFGLLFGLIGIILFYIIQMFKLKHINKT